MMQIFYETLHALNNSEFEIKLLSINLVNSVDSLVSWGGSI